MRSLMLVLTFVAATPTFAEPTSTDRPSLDPNERVCRSTQVVGSRVGRIRRFATRAQGVELDAEQRRQSQEMMRQGSQPQCMAPGSRAGPPPPSGAQCQ